MGLRNELYRRRKDNRFIVAALLGALGVFTLIYYLILRSRELPPDLVTNQLLLFVLRTINILLILTVLFVLIRNLFKLWLDSKHRILGAKFKTKLVATYIALSLLPVLLLFAYANELIQGSVENLFRTPVRDVLEQGNAVSQELTRRIQGTNLRSARRAAAEIVNIDLGDPRQRPLLGEVLKRRLDEDELDVLLVYQESEFLQGVVDPQAGLVELPDPGAAFLRQAMRDSEARRVLIPAGAQHRLILAARALGGAAQPGGVVVVGTVLDPAIAGKSEALVQAYQNYRQLEVQKPDLKASYLLLFLMVTLVILLFSSWVGLILARRVTVPIQALAEGTRRIMAGDLTHRVEAAADDELGVLVDSFNRMTSELEQNKLLLEAKNRELTEINARLDEERKLIGAVLQNVAAGVLSVDREGRVFTCNDAALEMLQQSTDQLLGQSLEKAWQDDERVKLLALFEYDPLGRSRREVDLVLGGEMKTFEVKTTTMFDAAGGVTGHVLVLEDLTQLIQAQKLATWNEAARRVAHEIKNPLTPIKLSAERLLRKHRQGDADLGPAIESSVGTIVREVGSMKAMVDEFSRFARMPQPQPTQVDLEQLFNETLDLYRDLKSGVVMHTSIADDVKRAKMDQEQMRGALINLLDNAVAATDPPGTVEISARRDNGSLVLRIADSGPGISADQKEKIFLPYFSTKGRGSGLGLAIVHRVVSDHNGTIRVEDNEPHGSVFTIEIPQ